MLKLHAFLPWINTLMLNIPWIYFRRVLTTFSKIYENFVKDIIFQHLFQHEENPVVLNMSLLKVH